MNENKEVIPKHKLRIGKVKIWWPLIRDAFGFPTDWEIMGDEKIELIISGADFPEQEFSSFEEIKEVYLIVHDKQRTFEVKEI